MNYTINIMKLDSVKKLYHDIFKKCNTLDDLYDITEDMNNKEKGNVWEIVSYYIILLSPILNRGLKNIWLYDDIPTKLIKELNLPKKDKGIDLIVQFEDEYVAIQSKFRQRENSKIQWEELSTFFGLAFGVGEKITRGLFITNTLKMCDEVNNSKKVKAIDGNFFDEQLPENFFKNICKLTKNEKQIEQKKIALLPHQIKCIVACITHFTKKKTKQNDNELSDVSRCHIVMPPGSGKTTTSYEIDKKLNNMLTVMLVPSLYLLSQVYAEYVNRSFSEKDKVKFLLIGSDVDTDDDTEYKAGELNLHADVKQIRKVIDQSIKNKEKLIVICTYQSSDKLQTACSENKKDKIKEIKFDMAIFDEAHKTVGQIGNQFTLMLDDTNLIIKKRLFMTATPKMYKGKINEKSDDDVLSMDNKKFYGECVFTYRVDEAIKEDILVDYDVITIFCTNKEIEELITKNKLVSFKKEFTSEESNYLGAILMILKKFHDGCANHMITYHNTVNRAKKFAEFLEKINKLLYKNKDEHIYVRQFDGKTSMAERNKIKKEFVSNKKSILCTAQVMKEGVNIPIIDSVCFVDPKNSTVDIVQCIGRTFRKYEGKKMAHIFIPTFIENLDDAVEDNAIFGNTIRIIKSMKSVDDNITEYFVFKQDEPKKTGRKMIKFESFVTIPKVNEIKINDWVANLECKLFQAVDNFMSNYTKYLKWINEHDDEFPSGESNDIEEKTIAKWAISQRYYEKKNMLSDYKIKQLEKINGWKWNDRKIIVVKSFDENFKEATKWIKDNKKFPSRHSKAADEKSIADWMGRQKTNYAKNKLTNTQIKCLNSINGWTFETIDAFNKPCEKLVKWFNKNTNNPSCSSKNLEEKKLGNFIILQRRKYYKKTITKEQIKKLENIKNWSWGKKVNTRAKTFEDSFSDVQKWIKENESYPNSATCTDDNERALGKWIVTQRQNKKNNKLSADKIKKLESLPNWYWLDNNKDDNNNSDTESVKSEKPKKIKKIVIRQDDSDIDEKPKKVFKVKIQK